MTRPLPDDFTEELVGRLAAGDRAWLFLDYDGTLAEFAPTPDHVLPDEEVIDLLERLTDHPVIRVSVISGRRLSHVRELIPVEGILLAGTYGAEIATQEGRLIHQVEHGAIRPILEELKPLWQELIAGREGFFLEDKGWALALHAKDAEAVASEQVLAEARHLAEERASEDLFRMLGGHRFLEIGPKLANKGRTVSYLLEQYELPGALLIYIGDDDKDEEAFDVIQSRGGICIKVATMPVETRADYLLDSPRAVRDWLWTVVDAPQSETGSS